MRSAFWYQEIKTLVQTDIPFCFCRTKVTIVWPGAFIIPEQPLPFISHKVRLIDRIFQLLLRVSCFLYYLITTGLGTCFLVCHHCQCRCLAVLPNTRYAGLMVLSKISENNTLVQVILKNPSQVTFWVTQGDLIKTLDFECCFGSSHAKGV